MRTHLQLFDREEHARVIVCGPPERAEKIALSLEGPQPLARNREYHSYLGTHNRIPVLVVSHGVGSAGAAICFQELVDAGAKEIIRVGTAGSLTEDGNRGDLVIATGAVRRDGASERLVPAGFPAVPDIALTHALLSTAPAAKSGLVLTSDLFHEGPLGNEHAFYAKAGAIAVDMECATLFVIGQLRRVRTAAILVADGNALRGREEKENYDPGADDVRIALETASRLAIETLTR